MLIQGYSHLCNASYAQLGKMLRGHFLLGAPLLILLTSFAVGSVISHQFPPVTATPLLAAFWHIGLSTLFAFVVALTIYGIGMAYFFFLYTKDDHSDAPDTFSRSAFRLITHPLTRIAVFIVSIAFNPLWVLL